MSYLPTDRAGHALAAVRGLELRPGEQTGHAGYLIDAGLRARLAVLAAGTVVRRDLPTRKAKAVSLATTAV